MFGNPPPLGGLSVVCEVWPCTRYAFPWRPVKPLEMIWEVRQRSVEHRAQWRREREWLVLPEERNLVVGGRMVEEAEEMGLGVGEVMKGLEEVGEMVVSTVLMLEEVMVEDVVRAVEEESLLSVEDWRDLRRKGTEGRR